tara:strand:+ start:1149 stop:1322 length:174 start_codon:yes stop_codon:yes gene_type:complete
MKTSKISVTPGGNGNAQLRIEHVLEKTADLWECAGVYSIVLPPEIREEVIAALVKCR